MEKATFTADYVAKGGLTLGYAITIHKSQGLTVGSDKATWVGEDDQIRGGTVLFYAAGSDNPGSLVAATRHKSAMWMFLARTDVEGAQDEYLLGIPKRTFDRTRRVITKLVDRAKATEVNANDRPVLVDLGLLDDPGHTVGERGVGGRTVEQQQARDNRDRKRARRAKRDAVDTARRATATVLLTDAWGEHPAVGKVTAGPAFGTVARWLDLIVTAGGDPHATLATIDPDEVTAPKVHDPSKLVASLVKRSANTDLNGDEATTSGARTPKTKAQRREERLADEKALLDQVADLLREEWGGHPTAELVITGPAFTAVTRNLAGAAATGHDAPCCAPSTRPPSAPRTTPARSPPGRSAPPPPATRPHPDRHDPTRSNTGPRTQPARRRRHARRPGALLRTSPRPPATAHTCRPSPRPATSADRTRSIRATPRTPLGGIRQAPAVAGVGDQDRRDLATLVADRAGPALVAWSRPSRRHRGEHRRPPHPRPSHRTRPRRRTRTTRLGPTTRPHTHQRR
ncbi:hypothetical protein ACFFQW_13045 [Umezawaea endophytica]|uniref:Uncharacterized protein n=1 Tax=Umezawaea endophytica TaxID=1654476 RepID=A0A9X3A0N3_9PSEU|nr:hypothetical protein [Umezawaea endophytica]MCS7478739.1 hypothetical protein [Umezawaea endophytica]